MLDHQAQAELRHASHTIILGLSLNVHVLEVNAVLRLDLRGKGPWGNVGCSLSTGLRTAWYSLNSATLQVRKAHSAGRCRDPWETEKGQQGGITIISNTGWTISSFVTTWTKEQWNWMRQDWERPEYSILMGKVCSSADRRVESWPMQLQWLKTS